jgi:hypothetical protein
MHITSVKGKKNANSVKPVFMVNLNYGLPMKATKVKTEVSCWREEYAKNISLIVLEILTSLNRYFSLHIPPLKQDNVSINI